MAGNLKKKQTDTLGRTSSSAAVNTPGVRPPATIEKETLRPLPLPPEKTPATIVHPPKSDASSGSTKSAGASYSGYGGSSASSSAAAADSSAAASVSAAAQRQAPTFSAPEEDEGARLRYESALAAFEQKRAEAPRYESRYDEQIRQLYEQITGRQPFRYDSATDPLYQQYVQDYTTQGARAMRNTMGQAAALTGGYGSSYAQSVGQQQYDAYLQRLADILPETYGMALDAYEAEGKGLLEKYDLTASLEKSDYERYLDTLGQYNRELELARADAYDAREALREGDEQAYRRAVDEYNRSLAADQLSYNREQDAYDRLVRLIAAGYEPSAEEYAQAGMSSAQGAALRAQNTAASGPTVIIRTAKTDKSSSKSSSGKSGSSKGGSKKTQGSLYKK